MIWLKRLVLLFQFLTTIPIPIRINASEKDYGKGLVFAPVVGVFIGGVLCGVYYGCSFLFEGTVAIVITIITYILLTGGIHIDGLGDTFDGVFSHRPKERILEIMRDSRIGTYGVLSICCLLLLNISMLSSLPKENILKVLLLMPVAGRIGSLVGAGASVYARIGEGLGKSFIEYCGIVEIAIGSIFYAGIFYLAMGLEGLALCLIPFVTAFLLVKALGRRIGGATGDILGAVCELNQSLFLITVCILIKFGGF